MAEELDYATHIKRLQEWLTDTGESSAKDYTSRDWCTLDMEESFSPEDLYAYFASSKPNTDFKTEVDLVTGSQILTNNPISQFQLESDHLDSLARMYLYRHQSRLKNYRDDAENKTVRTYSALSLSLAKLQHLKERMAGNVST